MNKKAKEYILLLLLLVVYIVLFPNDIFRCNMNSDQNENLLNEELNVIYDGEESEVRFDDEWYYIYRTN